MSRAKAKWKPSWQKDLKFEPYPPFRLSSFHITFSLIFPTQTQIMNKNLTLFTLLLLLALVSCNKDDNNNPAHKKVLDYIENAISGDRTFFTFNESGQIIRETEGDDVTTYTANGNQLDLSQFRNSENRVVADISYNLNADGNIISGTGDFTYPSSDPYAAAYTVEYNTDGFMTRRTNIQTDGEFWTYKYYWSNGDLTKMEWFSHDTLYLTIQFEYSKPLEDKLQIDVYKILRPTTSWTGKSSKHLPNHSFGIFAPGSHISYDYSYLYHLDADGYITSYLTHDAMGGLADSTVYHYQ